MEWATFDASNVTIGFFAVKTQGGDGGCVVHLIVFVILLDVRTCQGERGVVK